MRGGLDVSVGRCGGGTGDGAAVRCGDSGGGDGIGVAADVGDDSGVVVVDAVITRRRLLLGLL